MATDQSLPEDPDVWFVFQDGKMRSSKTEPAQTPVYDALAIIR